MKEMQIKVMLRSCFLSVRMATMKEENQQNSHNNNNNKTQETARGSKDVRKRDVYSSDIDAN